MRKSKQNIEPLLTTAEAAAYLKVSPRTLLNYRNLGLPFLRLRGRLIRYRLSALNKYVRVSSKLSMNYLEDKKDLSNVQ